MLDISFPVSDFSEIKREILKHGDAVTVIKPESLRELIKSEAINIAKIYLRCGVDVGFEEGGDEEDWRKVEEYTGLLSPPDSYPIRLNNC